MTTTTPIGLLLATMEPPANIEEEFQDWYDTEHFPERQGCPGFLTANRFVCVDGFPRYLAMYDLADVEVLRGEDYRKIAHAKYSAWTHRIIAKVWGQYRAEGVQVYPGGALHGAAGVASRLVLWRFRGVAADGGEAALVAGLRALYEGKPGTVQLRIFRVAPNESGDYLAMAESSTPPAPVDSAALALLGPAAKHVDLVNTYVAYARQAPGAFPKSR
jgi:hypothetical protein